MRTPIVCYGITARPLRHRLSLLQAAPEAGVGRFPPGHGGKAVWTRRGVWAMILVLLGSSGWTPSIPEAFPREPARTREGNSLSSPFRVYLPLVVRQEPQALSGVDFGLVFITSAEQPADPARFDRARGLGARWDRWPLYWSGVETSPGVYQWAHVDQALRDALAQGFEVSLILMGTPGFYAAGGLSAQPPIGGSILRQPSGDIPPDAPIRIAAANPPAGLYAPVFTDGTDRPGPGKTINPANRWAAFVYQAVARYRPGGTASREVPGWPAGRGVRAWEIWNEPDLSSFWSGSAADYARLLKVGTIAARQADPQARILFGGLAIFEKPGWLQEVLRTLQNDPDPDLRDAFGWYFDVLPIHSYSYAWQTFRYLNQVKGTLQSFGLVKELWVNESGLPVWDDPMRPPLNPDSPYRGTMTEQAAYLVQSTAYAIWMGARVVYFFMLHDDCGNIPQEDAFGLYRNPPDYICVPLDGSARPAAAAYRLVTTHLRGATPLWRLRTTDGRTDWGACTGQVEWFAFRRPDGARVLLAWTRLNVPATITVTAVAPQGVIYDVRTGAATGVRPTNGIYTFSLPPATNYNTPTLCNPAREKQGEAAVGGIPLFLVEGP